MSLHEEIAADIQREIEAASPAIPLSPTTLALAVLSRLSAEPLTPKVQYASLEHLKQMARKALAGRYEPDGAENDAHQGDMFSGHLQDRYPVPRVKGADPIYKPRDVLSADELAWNVGQLRKAAAARLRHADALQAWADDRMQAQRTA